ncbi:MAG: TlpA family protein disulfide reductase [Microthrixaceae bacterium]|nr:TlpA family protein disulfide reductase [Microthrixaceae bacterium]
MSTKRRGANPYDRESKPTTGENRNLPWIIGGAAVAAVLLIAAAVFLWPSGGDDADAGTGAAAAANAEQETASLTISGEDLPLLEGSGLGAPGTDSAVGLAIPKLAGESFDGSEVTIDPSDGEPKLVVFLAHWCPNCQQEVPVVQEWIDDGSVPDGLDLYSVSTAVDSGRPNYPPSNWLSGEGWTPPVLLDNEAADAANAWGLPGYPYFVFVDSNGNVWRCAALASSAR